MKKDSWIVTGTRPLWRWVLVLSVAALATGCGGGGTPEDLTAGMTDEQKAIDVLVGTVADYSGSSERLRTLFTKEGAPSGSAVPKYGQYMYYVADGTQISVTGTSATVPVTMTRTGEESPTPVEKQWKVEKVGDEWKLSDAPLP
jgi:hypothetical protein